jgi:hypothetical protein
MYSKGRLAALLTVLALFSPALSYAATSSATTTEAQVRAYFWDLPVMSAIARCESEFTQFNPDGSVLHGGYKKSMIGIYQIAPMHIPEALALNLDVNTIEGNMGYARYLYTQNGTNPWLDSKWCWQNLPESSMVVDNKAKLAMIQKQIDSIQEAINRFK